MCLRGICRCPQQRGSLCNSYGQTVRLLTVKLFLGTMRPLGLLRIELWRLSSPLMLNTRGSRASPSGVGLHPAPPASCYATGSGAKLASACRWSQVYACWCKVVRASTSALQIFADAPSERVVLQAENAQPTFAVSAMSPMSAMAPVTTCWCILRKFTHPQQHVKGMLGCSSTREPTFWVWELHYVRCVNASPEGSEPMIYYRMVVFRISCTMLFQVLRGAWSAIVSLCSHWD